MAEDCGCTVTATWDNAAGSITDFKTTIHRCPMHAQAFTMLAALEKQRDKAKWAWQFVSAVASDNHNRQHNLEMGRTEPLRECTDSMCRNWCDDLDDYKATISDSEKAIAAARGGAA